MGNEMEACWTRQLWYKKLFSATVKSWKEECVILRDKRCINRNQSLWKQECSVCWDSVDVQQQFYGFFGFLIVFSHETLQCQDTTKQMQSPTLYTAKSSTHRWVTTCSTAPSPVTLVFLFLNALLGGGENNSSTSSWFYHWSKPSPTRFWLSNPTSLVGRTTE